MWWSPPANKSVAKNDRTALIEVDCLTRIYGEDGAGTAALHNVTFTIDRGEFVAIMGPSGSGKSTLLHLLGLLDRPTRGTYRLDGTTVADFTDAELAHFRNRMIGFVFQAFNLLPRLTVLQNIMVPLLYSDIPESSWKKRAEHVIQTVGLTHRAHHEAATLSGGEKQRAAIARALVMNPEVIFADEPTGNLDSRSGEIIMETIRDLHETLGRTIVLVTHESYAASYARRVITLRDGEIVQDEKNAHHPHKGDGYQK